MTTDATTPGPQRSEGPDVLDYPDPPTDVLPTSPRLWFPITVVLLFWAFRFTWQQVELVTFTRFAGSMLAILLMLLMLSAWWLFRSRMAWRNRLGVAGAFVAAAVVTAMLTQKTFGTMALLITALPVVFTAGVIWLVAARRAASSTRVMGLVMMIFATWLAFTTLRLDGLSADQVAQFRWRWTPSAESLYLAQRSGGSVTTPTTSVAPVATDGDSPGYLGALRDGVVRGVTLAADWDARPPRQLWRRRVGPAWSSLAVAGTRLYTQEQQGEAEAVVCLEATTGSEIWSHRDDARFWESVAGAGPRATPTYANGSVFTLGGTGILNCLDAASGTVRWTRDVKADSGAPVPIWGFSSSPLVTKGGLVVVYAGGDKGKSVLAYNASDGSVAWAAPAGTMSYASPQPAYLLGVDQVLALSDRGLTSLDPLTGKVLWEHLAQTPNAPRSVQPVLVDPSHVLMASEADIGLAMLDVGRDSSHAWTVHPRWTTRAMKPAFNHVAVEGGHAYGFDGSMFACVDLATGERKWRSGRYGRGQVLLIEDSHQLLVLAEDGRVVLLRATPEKREELGSFQAIEGKTWNHPLVTRDRLYVRNAEEMACYRWAGPGAK